MEREEKPSGERKVNNSTGGEHRNEVLHLKEEAEELVRGLFSDEVKQHIINAGSELLLALDAMIPRSLIPEEARIHHRRMKKEFLLMVKSMIDAKLSLMEDSESRREKGLKKIDLD